MVSLPHSEGECPVNNDNFLIEEIDLDFARDICKYIEDPEKRNRAVANAVAGNIAEKYFTEIEVDTKSGLHNISYVLNNLEIADIYINNCYIDVRLYFNDNEMCVPKSLYDKGIEPSAFMFIKLTPDLSGGTVTGFVLSNEINTENESNGYYKVNEEQLTSFYDIEPLLIDKPAPEFVDDIDQKVFSFLDGSMENIDEFYQELINSKDARERLAVAAKAQNIFNYISVTKTTTESFSNNKSLPEEAQEELSIDINSPETLSLETDGPVDLNLADDINLASDSIEPIGELEESVEPVEDLDLTANTVSFDLEDSNSVADLEDFTGGEVEDLTEISVNTSDNEVISEDLSENESENENINLDASNITLVPEEPESLGTIATEDNQINTLEYENIGIEDDQEPVIEEEIKEYAPEILIQDEEETSENITDNEIPEYISETTREQENTVASAAQNEFNYSTETTPSISSIEDGEVDMNNLETLLDNEPSQEDVQTGVEDNEPSAQDETAPQIDTLFNQTPEEEEIDNTVIAPKKKNSKLIPVVGVIAVLGAIGYFSYTKFANPAPSELPLPANDIEQTARPKQNTPKKPPVQEAMPVETVENIQKPAATEEAASVSIPAIEQNLDASILVSNLSVNWEVPSGYVSNNTAKRYFLKLGKIIQLNLKTELLLLSKPPITNKISVEVEYNKNTKKFEVKGIIESSGEKTVDDIILKTVNNALDINLRMNTSSFGNITGNPVLVIHL